MKWIDIKKQQPKESKECIFWTGNYYAEDEYFAEIGMVIDGKLHIFINGKFVKLKNGVVVTHWFYIEKPKP
jgi:ethanolamine utilization protein EutQ (cupin superfamily)